MITVTAGVTAGVTAAPPQALQVPAPPPVAPVWGGERMAEGAVPWPAAPKALGPAGELSKAKAARLLPASQLLAEREARCIHRKC